MLFQVIGVLSTYLIAVSMGSELSYLYFFILLPVIWLAGLLPVSINGLGIREGSFVFLFRSTGMSEEMANDHRASLVVSNNRAGVNRRLVVCVGEKKER